MDARDRAEELHENEKHQRHQAHHQDDAGVTSQKPELEHHEIQRDHQHHVRIHDAQQEAVAVRDGVIAIILAGQRTGDAGIQILDLV